MNLERLAESNFADFEKLTCKQEDGGCYCAFWHQKWASIDDWKKRQKEAPGLNRETMLDRVRSNFHVGVLAYREGELVAWLSVAPLSEVHWAWRRVAQVGDAAKTVAGITCMVVAPSLRGQGQQAGLLRELLAYGRAQKWTAIEGYPFDASAVAKHKEHVSWPGLTKGYVEAGFERVGPHWLSQPEWERSIYSAKLA